MRVLQYLVNICLFVIYRAHTCFIKINFFVDPVKYFLLCGCYISTKFSNINPKVEQMQRMQVSSVHAEGVSRDWLLWICTVLLTGYFLPHRSLWTKAKATAQIKHILYVYLAATQQKSHCSNCKILLRTHNTNQQKPGWETRFRMKIKIRRLAHVFS